MQLHVPDALVEIDGARDVRFRLPLDSQSQLPALLRALSAEETRGPVADYALGVTSLEDVFVKIADGHYPQGNGDNSSSEPTKKQELAGAAASGGAALSAGPAYQDLPGGSSA